MKNYRKFYNFIIQFIPEDKLTDLNINEDSKVLDIFNNGGILVSNLLPMDLKKYLIEICMSKFSFSKEYKCSLYKIYSNKLNIYQKGELLDILDSLSHPAAIFKDLITNDLQRLSYEKIQYSHLLNLLFTGSWTIDKISKLIDLIFLDDILKNKVLTIINEYVKEYSIDIKPFNNLLDDVSSNFNGLITLMDLIMQINPKIKMYVIVSKFKQYENHISDFFNKSQYLLNIKQKLRKRTLNRNLKNTKNKNIHIFKIKYNIYETNKDIPITDNPLNVFNEIDSCFDYELKEIEYSFSQFKAHLSALIYYLVQVILGLKEIKPFISLKENILKEVKIEEEDKIEKQEIYNYVQTFLNTISNNDIESMDNLILFFKNNKDKALKLIKDNKDIFINKIKEIFLQLGIKRIDEITANFDHVLDLDLDNTINNLILNLDDKETEEYLLKCFKYIGTIVNFFNTNNIKNTITRFTTLKK